MKRFLLFLAALWLAGMAIATPITLRVQKPAEWSAMYLHYWNTSLGETQWPGVQLTPDSLGWCYFTFENDSVVNYIWNNGNGTQTNNLLTRVNVCERLVAPQPHISNPNWEPVAVDCGSLPPIVPDTTSHDTVPQQTSITLGFQAPAEWDSVYIHYWNTSLGSTGWPGVLLTKDSLGWSYFTFPNDQVVNYIWNNGRTGGGTNQTVDLTANCDKCERVGGISAGGNYVISFAECGSRAPWDTITPVVPDTTSHDTIPAPQPQGGITVKLAASTVPASWENVYLLSWTSGVDQAVSTGNGLLLTPDSSGWYSYTFPAELKMVEFLFDNGNWGAGNQTKDYATRGSVCYGLGDPTTTENNYFPLFLVDCETGIPPVDSTVVHTIYLIDKVTRQVFRTIPVVHGGNVLLPTDSLPYHEGYHFVFWEGRYDGDYMVYNVTSDQYWQATYYIDLPEQPAENPVTVRLKGSTVPENWNKVYIYSWTAGAMNGIEWPGAEMQMDDNGWYTYTFPAGVQNIDFLFDNGKGNIGNQSMDVDDVNNNLCFEMAAPLSNDGYYMVYLTDCNDIDTTGLEPITVRFMSPNTFGWQNGDTYIYAWQNVNGTDVPILGEWPGTPMQKDTVSGWYSYTLPARYQNFNAVINAIQGGVQTEDIMQIHEDFCLRTESRWYTHNNMLTFGWHSADCAVAPVGYHLVKFINQAGYVFNFQQVLDGDSAIAPEPPYVHGYMFAGWDQDFSNVTSDLAVRATYVETAVTSNLQVRLIPTNGYGWQDVYLYAWTYNESGQVEQILGNWPGTRVPKDSVTGWHTYTFTHDSAVNIVWNDGVSGRGLTHQTQNLENVSESTCYRLYGLDSIGHTVAEPIACTVNPNIIHTVAFIDVDFDNQLLMVAQEAHGYNLPISPGVPQHEGYVFKYWMDVATMTEFTGNEPIERDMFIDEAYERLSYPVYMVNWDGSFIASGNIFYGNSVNNVDEFSAYREGYEFIGWSDNLQNITSVRISVAQFRPITDGNTAIIYTGKNNEILATENVDLNNMPDPPTYEGYTFEHWEVVGGDIAYGIRIQAVYVSNPITGAPEVDGDERGARKVLRDSTIYIITKEGLVYTSDGKLVEKK